jgi:hypothetical protein
MAQVIITIKSDGQSTVETQGLSGSSCQSMTRDIENALGKTTEDQKKPEFFQASQTRQEMRG